MIISYRMMYNSVSCVAMLPVVISWIVVTTYSVVSIWWITVAVIIAWISWVSVVVIAFDIGLWFPGIPFNCFFIIYQSSVFNKQSDMNSPPMWKHLTDLPLTLYIISFGWEIWIDSSLVKASITVINIRFISSCATITISFSIILFILSRKLFPLINKSP